jgi:rubrerythrin
MKMTFNQRVAQNQRLYEVNLGILAREAAGEDMRNAYVNEDTGEVVKMATVYVCDCCGFELADINKFDYVDCPDCFNSVENFEVCLKCG